MKKLILGLSVMAALAITASAGLFSTVSGMSMEEQKPSASYTVDTAGINPRIYEFTPKGNRNIVCVLIFGNSGDGVSVPAMQCFNKEGK